MQKYYRNGSEVAFTTPIEITEIFEDFLQRHPDYTYVEWKFGNPLFVQKVGQKGISYVVDKETERHLGNVGEDIHMNLLYGKTA